MSERRGDGTGERREERSTSEDAPKSDGGTAIEPADFGEFQGHEPVDDLGHDTEHCIRCGFCTTACPVFAETGWESVSPRGHANVIAAYLEGDLDADDGIEENLDLCIKCKGCISPCPAGVEIPKLVMRAHEKYHEEHGVSLADRAFANPRLLNRLGSLAAPLSTLAGRLGPVRALAESVLGIDSRRPLPEFSRRTFEDWFAGHEPAPPEGDLDRDVAVFVDCYVNYNEPRIGEAAVRVLERAGATVELAENGCCGRAALSKGLIDRAEGYADDHVGDLAALVEEGYDVVAVEPSCAAMLEDDYADFYDDPRVDALVENSYEVMEYLARQLDRDGDLLSFSPVDRRVAVHTHCHTKHLGIDGATAQVLGRVPDLDVDEPHVQCCGMAGSFGYQEEYYDLSMDIGENLFEQVRASGGDPLATGFSCRHQIEDGMGIEAAHPIELVEESTRP